MHIDDLMPARELCAAIRDGLVRERRHGGLRILNYTKKCQADAAWSHVTMTCRGLIADEKGRVVARPFPKFFYPGEPAAPALPDPSTGRWEMRVCEKLDGVLGVGYVAPDGSSRVSTRGSLTSEQGVEANRILAERYPNTEFSARHYAAVRGHQPCVPHHRGLRHAARSGADCGYRHRNRGRHCS